ncbi:penicillin-insensitive murein endopeptidase [Candidatus Woesearchaeota archaeon]|nr:penicillin-insensitive murein endopeptidase [Candidatus Woesearchaeota archaeon]
MTNKKYNLQRKITLSKDKLAVSVFMVLLLVVVMYAVFSIWAALLNISSFSHTVGDDAFALLQTYETGEKVLFYVDQVGEQTYRQSLFDLGKKGGFYQATPEQNKCGTYRGSSLWYAEPEYCFPEKEKEALAAIFAENMKQMLSFTPIDEVEEKSPDIKYNLFSQENKFLAITKDKIPIKSQPLQLLNQGLQSFAGFPDCNKPSSTTLQNTYGDGGRIWIPREAQCGGSFPIIILLHGQSNPGVFEGQKVYQTAEQLISARQVYPVILVEQYAKKEHWVNDNPWPVSKYNINDHVVEIEKQLAQYNIRIKHVSVLGHSAANCYSSGGLRTIARDRTLFLLGMLDPTCNTNVPAKQDPKQCPQVQDYGEPHIAAIEGKGTILVGVNGNKKCSDQISFPTMVGQTPEDIKSSKKIFDQERFIAAYKNPQLPYYNFQIHSDYYSHGNAIGIGFKEILLQFFKPELQQPFTMAIPEDYNGLKCRLTQFTVDSQSIGDTHSGSLANAAVMPASGDLPYISQYRFRETYYTTKEFAEIIERVACIMQANGYDKLRFNDLSKQQGGTIFKPSGKPAHVSHKSGRDGDFGFYYFPDAQAQQSKNQLVDVVNNPKGSPSLKLLEGTSRQMFDVKGNWILARTFVQVAEQQGTPITKIIADEILYNLLIDYGQKYEQDKTVFEKTKNALFPDTTDHDHFNHFHIRIKCPLNDKIGGTPCIDD